MGEKQQDREGKSKRQLMREQRAKQAQRQRFILIGVVAAVAVILIALIARPNTQVKQDIIQVTPVTYAGINGKAIGDPNAPVRIEIFEDFLCSACKNYTQFIEPTVLENIVSGGQVYYVFHNYPFLDDRSVSKDSDQAAWAAECAAEQNRFWDYKNMLYANSKEVSGVFSGDVLKEYAKILGLDTAQFNACYDEGRSKDKVAQDLALGEAKGVTGTPTVYVNGVDVSPGKVPTADQIQALVNQALAGNLPQPTTQP